MLCVYSKNLDKDIRLLQTDNKMLLNMSCKHIWKFLTNNFFFLISRDSRLFLLGYETPLYISINSTIFNIGYFSVLHSSSGVWIYFINKIYIWVCYLFIFLIYTCNTRDTRLLELRSLETMLDCPSTLGILTYGYYNF